MSVSPSAQRVIRKIQNKSAYIKSSLDLIENLKKAKGNPKAVNAVGAQNLAILFANIFQRFFDNNKENLKKDCRTIKQQLLMRIEQLKAQLEENKKQGDDNPEIDKIVEELNKLKRKFEKLDCDILDPNGDPEDDQG